MYQKFDLLNQTEIRNIQLTNLQPSEVQVSCNITSKLLISHKDKPLELSYRFTSQRCDDTSNMIILTALPMTLPAWSANTPMRYASQMLGIFYIKKEEWRKWN